MDDERAKLVQTIEQLTRQQVLAAGSARASITVRLKGFKRKLAMYDTVDASVAYDDRQRAEKVRCPQCGAQFRFTPARAADKEGNDDA